MRLDRDISQDGCGKYAIVNLRKLELCAGTGTFERWTPEITQAMNTLEDAGVLEWGRTGTSDEFFVIKLKDQYAKHALEQYAAAVGSNDPEYADAVFELAQRAGENSPFCKHPD